MNWKQMRSLIGRAAMVGALTASGAEVTLAQTAATASGNWSDGGTWTAGEPAAGVLATINGGLTVTADQAGETVGTIDLGTISGETGNLVVESGTGMVVSGGGIPSIRVGQAAGSTGVVSMNGGTVDINGAVGSGFAIGDLLVGDVGHGTLTMTGGTMNVADEVFVALGGPSVGVLDMQGGTLNINGRNLLLGFFGGANATFNLSGSAVVNVDELLFSSFDPNATSVINQTGGTLNIGVAIILGRSGGSTYNHSGGAINVPTNNGDLVVGEGAGPVTTYNISGTATVDLLHNVLVGVAQGASGIVNQTGGTIAAGDNLIIGRDGVGVWNLDGGETNATGVFLGDFDSSQGTLKIAGGTLNLTGNLSVGGALASNAAPDRVEPNGMNGPQGQALDANGVLIVSGNGGVINVDGNLLANPSDKSSFRSDPFAPGGDNSATLVFEIFSNAGTSLIDVAGVADLDGAVIDLDLMGGFSPALGATFDLLTAASFGSTGAGTTQNVGSGDGFTLASEDAGLFSLAIVPGGNGVILQATAIPEPAAWSLATIALAGLAARRRRCV